MKKFKFYTTAEIEQILESKNEIDSDYQWSIYSNQQKLHTWFRELIMSFHIARVNVSNIKLNLSRLEALDSGADLSVPEVIRINGQPTWAFRHNTMTPKQDSGVHFMTSYETDKKRKRVLKDLGWVDDWLLDFYGVPQVYLILCLWFMPHKTLKEIAKETPFSYGYLHRNFLPFQNLHNYLLDRLQH